MTQTDRAAPSLRQAPCLLVTGFGPFPGFPANPSALVVESLAAQAWAAEGVTVAYRVLPTTWAGAVESLRQAIARTGADSVLMTGVAASAMAFRVEMRAQNKVSASALDAEGRRHGDPRISPLGPAVLRATAPVESLLEALRGAGMPAEASSNAGDYLCNYGFYRLLADRERERDELAVAFLHLPPAREAPPQADAGFVAFSLADLEAGVKLAAQVLAGALIHAPRREAIDA